MDNPERSLALRTLVFATATWALVVAPGCQNVVLGADSDSSGAGPSESTTATTGMTTAVEGSTTTEPSPTETTTPAESSTSTSTGVGTSGPPPFLFDVGGSGATGTDDGGETGPVIDWDCDDLVQPFEMETELGAARGYHDVYFDADGHLLGWDGNSIVAVTYDNELSVFLPGVNSAQGMDVLDDGDLLYLNDSGELRRVSPDAQSTTIASGFFGAYGVTVGPDQQAYVCWSSGVTRVDPDSGETSVFVTLPNGTTPRALVFNLDSTGVYMSTLLAPQSPVYFMEVDSDLDPSSDPVIFATNVGQGYHDGLAIDACGNLYVPDYSTSGLYRVDPEGVVTVMYSGEFNHYGHGMEFGSGIDGWNDRAIYLPQPYDGFTVNEVVLGVPSGSYVRTWNQ